MKNILALLTGMFGATWAINHWLKYEQKLCGLVSGGQVIVPPPQTPSAGG